jgi:drug/metabolite transporter (DMT)-like permease
MDLLAPILATIVLPIVIFATAIRMRRRRHVTIRDFAILGFVAGSGLVFLNGLDGKSSFGSTLVTAIVFGIGGALFFGAVAVFSKYSGRSKIDISW